MPPSSKVCTPPTSGLAAGPGVTVGASEPPLGLGPTPAEGVGDALGGWLGEGLTRFPPPASATIRAIPTAPAAARPSRATERADPSPANRRRRCGRDRPD